MSQEVQLWSKREFSMHNSIVNTNRKYGPICFSLEFWDWPNAAGNGSNDQFRLSRLEQCQRSDSRNSLFNMAFSV